MGKLVQVATETVTSAVASVTLTGIDSDDVYMISISGWTCSVDNKAPFGRVTVSGTGQTTNYAGAQLNLHSNSAFVDGYYSSSFGSDDKFYFAEEIGTGTSEQCNMIIYLYNFNNSSEYSFISYEPVEWTASPRLTGRTGGGVHLSTETNNGMEFFMASGNITGGVFTMYKVL
jgi:hypothetical protein